MKQGQGQTSVYFSHTGPCRDPEDHRHCPGRWRGAISLGFGPGGKRLRKYVTARTKTAVRAKLQDLREELATGVRPKEAYTVADAVEEWLAHGLSGRSPKTVAMNRYTLRPVTGMIGKRPLRKLTAADVRAAPSTPTAGSAA